MWPKQIRSLFYPNRYHGWGKNRKYFEGWYYKVITANEKYAFAFIPGIAIDELGNKHAFIQVLDGKAETAEYIRFPVEKFVSQANTFKTKIGDNVFTLDKMLLHLEQYKGELTFAHRNNATELASPVSGFMAGRISESMTSTVDAMLTAKLNNKIIFNDTGRNAALEVAGKINEITIL